MIDSYFLQTYEETRAWLDSMKIENYIINDDLIVDVNVNVNLYDKNLTRIPVQFGKVNGSFYCYNNKLISLKGTPKTVNDFYCGFNTLEDITDLDSKILINSIKNDRLWIKQISTELYNDYFEHWISKDYDIISVLKDKVSKKCLRKYKLNIIL